MIDDDLSAGELMTLAMISKGAREADLIEDCVPLLYLRGLIDRYSDNWFVTEAGHELLKARARDVA